ncbi:MAG: ATP-dependent DNA helicase RecG [Candidatus Dormiibacterota bacterium]
MSTTARFGPPLTVSSALRDVPRIGQVGARQLERLGLRTVGDLLLDLPVRMEAYTDAQDERYAFRDKEKTTVTGHVGWIGTKRIRTRKLPLVEMTLLADVGASVQVTWFNRPDVARKLQKGDRVLLAGAVRSQGWGVRMTNPTFERVGADGVATGRVGGLQPVYGLTAGLKPERIRSWVEGLLPLADQREDSQPARLLDRLRILPLADAVRQGHQPASDDEFRVAKHRMQVAEMLELQVAFGLSRRGREQERATPVPYRQEVIDTFKGGLPFELTVAQRRAIWEVYRDLEGEHPMNRLVDGDVGSGKTAVAAAAAAMVHANGQQSVLLAPTEILARQHLQKCRSYLEQAFGDLRVDLLVSGLPAAERRRVRTAAASGHTALLVGTHALLEDEVELQDLGLAIVDEQHRFGTRQRELLRAKAHERRPHLLAMTATPIPRTFALAIYGEMALSVIDELPAGRTPVVTQVVELDRREGAYALVREQARLGHQAFIICPLIEGTETSTAKAATDEFERLRKEVFGDLRLALVHGRVKNKDEVMDGFRAGQADILVATSVIEVGVDVPNATVMLIEGADRFGLAQLHQFRGRVGRSALQSYCLLLADDATDAGLGRLRLLESTTDGFEVAKLDFERRGPGQLIGNRQHGERDAAMAALEQPELLSETREVAEELLSRDPDLRTAPLLEQRARERLEQTAMN